MSGSFANAAPFKGGRKRRGSRKMKMMKGGDGTAENAIKIYGDAGEQHAGANGNVIAANAPAASASSLSVNDAAGNNVYKGGKRRRKSQKGGLGVGDLAVPAVLLIANQQFKPRGFSGKRGRRFSRRRSSRRR